MSGIRDPEMLGDDPCYTAHKSCGCMVAAIVDKPEHASDVKQQLAKWYRQGLDVERGKVRDVWQGFTGWHCPHEQQQEAFL